MNIVDLALKIATEAHKGQFRRDGITPYIEHPKRVAESLKQYYSCDNKNDELKTVALLHDVLEDTNLTASDLISKGIPNIIVQYVEILTHQKNISYLDYILQIKNCKSNIPRIVKIADMKDNLKTSKGSQKAKYELAIYILNK